MLQAQKLAISLLQLGNGCDANNYKAVCDVLSNIISTLQTDLTDNLNNTGINYRLDEIAQYQ
ncbi:TPA: hypothetical protein DCZ39_00635 [Patescibacteria group bacterium]|nr:hypothetical protein [Candidatus Gracilibacteria bacterium]